MSVKIGRLVMSVMNECDRDFFMAGVVIRGLEKVRFLTKRPLVWAGPSGLKEALNQSGSSIEVSVEGDETRFDPQELEGLAEYPLTRPYVCHLFDDAVKLP